MQQGSDPLLFPCVISKNNSVVFCQLPYVPTGEDPRPWPDKWSLLQPQTEHVPFSRLLLPNHPSICESNQSSYQWWVECALFLKNKNKFKARGRPKHLHGKSERTQGNCCWTICNSCSSHLIASTSLFWRFVLRRDATPKRRRMSILICHPLLDIWIGPHHPHLMQHHLFFSSFREHVLQHVHD
jgi:hypothetical protein